MHGRLLAFAFLLASAGPVLAENATAHGLRPTAGVAGVLDAGTYHLRLLPSGGPRAVLSAAMRPAIDPQTTGSINTDRMTLRSSVAVPDSGHRWSWSDEPEIRGALGSALDRSAALRASLADVDAARARTFRAMAAFMPVITGNVTSVLASDGQVNSLGETYTTGGINLTMPLFTGGQNWNNLKSARARERAAQFDANTRAETIVMDVLASHVEAEFAATQLSIAESNLSTLRRLRNSVSQRAKAGFASGADLADIDANIALAERQMEAARGGLASARQVLSLSTGRESAPRGISLERVEGLLAGGRDALIASARSRSNFIASAREQAHAAEFQKRAAYGRYAPRVDLTGEYTQVLDQGSTGSVDPNRYSIQVRLRVPIVDFSTMSDVKEARALAASAGYRAQDAVREVERQIIADWESYVAMTRQLEASAREIGAAGKSLVSRQKQFEAGLINADAVTTQAQKAADARLSEAQLQAERKITIIRLASAAGLL